MTLHRKIAANYPHYFPLSIYLRELSHLSYHRSHFWRGVNKFSDKIIITNNNDKIKEIKSLMDKFQNNLTFCIPLLFANPKIFYLESFIENKYFMKTNYKFPLVDAVIFVPEDKIEYKREGKINNYVDPLFNNLIPKEFYNNNDNYLTRGELRFNEPKDWTNVFPGEIVTSDLYGSANKMNLKEIYDKVKGLPDYKTIFVNGEEITSDDSELLKDGKEYNVVILCEKTISEMSKSYRSDKDSQKYKNEIKKEYKVDVNDDYFVDKGIELTFAHEIGHILLGHLENTVKKKINKETQANFMASLMLNNSIDSIYIHYKTKFQPIEYQRTMLLNANFSFADLTKAFIEILKLN